MSETIQNMNKIIQIKTVGDRRTGKDWSMDTFEIPPHIDAEVFIQDILTPYVNANSEKSGYGLVGGSAAYNALTPEQQGYAQDKAEKRVVELIKGVVDQLAVPESKLLMALATAQAKPIDNIQHNVSMDTEVSRPWTSETYEPRPYELIRPEELNKAASGIVKHRSTNSPRQGTFTFWPRALGLVGR